MTDFIKLFFGFFYDMWDVLFDYPIEFYGYSVSIGAIMLAFLCISLFCYVFFKGAKG